jgi:hypothetical protein
MEREREKERERRKKGLSISKDFCSGGKFHFSAAAAIASSQRTMKKKEGTR